jgi:gliding motility-associated-like protein
MKCRIWYLLMFMTCASFLAQAQFTSRLGRFKVDQVKGCVPLTVTITIISPWKCDGANPCDMFFGETTAGQNLTFTHTYTTSGSFLLKILFQTSGYDDITITPTPNTQPQFDVFSCGGNQVSVNIPDTNYNQYVIDYNDGTPVKVVPVGNLAKDTHSYASSGAKTVTVRGRNTSAADNCNPTSKTVNALATLPPAAINLLTVQDANSIKLDFNGLPNIQYKIEIATNNGTTFQFLKTTFNVTTETISNLKTDDNYYCFRIGVFDPCANTIVYSPVICSANFDLATQNNSNDVSFVTTTTGTTNFRLTRTTSGSSFSTTITSSPYNDTAIICGTNYCYQLTTNYPNGSQSISLQKCGTAISTDAPAPIENITGIVGAKGVDLQWTATAGFTPKEFSIYKSSGPSYDLVSTSTALTYSDPTYLTENKTCYKVSYTDVCNNKSALSLEACPIRLAGGLAKDNSINLSWSAYTGWRDDVSEYLVEKYSQAGKLLQTVSAGTSTSFLDDAQDLTTQIYIYIVKATAVQSGLPQAVSNPITVIKDPNLFHPTAFTPNGDNLNDVFNVFGHYIVDFEMNIFNRWGELLYTTTDIQQGWDGQYKGNAMPEGTYTYIAKITDLAGRRFTKSGSVLLLRKSK